MTILILLLYVLFYEIIGALYFLLGRCRKKFQNNFKSFFKLFNHFRSAQLPNPPSLMATATSLTRNSIKHCFKQELQEVRKFQIEIFWNIARKDFMVLQQHSFSDSTPRAGSDRL